MYVCICNKVTDKQIHQARNEGAVSLDCLMEKLDVATCCGRCGDCAEQVLHSNGPQIQSMTNAAISAVNL